MKERAVTFGKSHNLVGIVNEPDGGPPSGRPRAVILINAGLLNRSGPHRLYVTLARALSTQGFLTLRFDHSGLGDSDSRPDDLTYPQGVVTDTQTSMDFLTDSYGTESFVLGGLCSGADHAFLAAHEDERVEGGILLDWYAYRTAGYFLRHYGPRFLRTGPWLRKLEKGVKRIRTSPFEGLQRQIDPYARGIPPVREVEGKLKSLVDRGSRFLCVYTGGQSALYNHSDQFFKMFPNLDPKGLIRSEYFPKAEHTFPRVENRQRLVDLVLEWMGTQPERSGEGG